MRRAQELELTVKSRRTDQAFSSLLCEFKEHLILKIILSILQ